MSLFGSLPGTGLFSVFIHICIFVPTITAQSCASDECYYDPVYPIIEGFNCTIDAVGDTPPDCYGQYSSITDCHCINSYARLVNDQTFHCSGGSWGSEISDMTCEDPCTHDVNTTVVIVHTGSDCTTGEVINGSLPVKDSETVCYECPPDYTPYGESITSCDDGVWDVSNTFTCTGSSCNGEPPKGDDMLSHVPSTAPYDSGTVVVYSCPNGYQVDGSASAVCDNGNWTLEEIPSCSPIPTGLTTTEQDLTTEGLWTTQSTHSTAGTVTVFTTADISTGPIVTTAISTGLTTAERELTTESRWTTQSTRGTVTVSTTTNISTGKTDTTGDQSCPSESLTYSGVHLSFPTTTDGATANSSETCGEDTTNPNAPLATRLCLSSEWMTPVFLTCYSPDEVAEEIENIADTPVTDDNIEEVASDLALVTTQTDDLGPEQIDYVAESLEHIVDTGSSSSEVTDSVIGTVNNVMAVDENELQETEGTASVVTSLEQQVTNVQQNPENYTDIQDNVGVQAVKVDPEITRGLTFVVQIPVDLNATDRLKTDFSEENTKLYNHDGKMVGNDTTTSIYIPPAVLSNVPEGHVNVPISFIIYKDARLFQTSETEVSDGPVISSQVISATVENISVGQLPQDSLVITRFLTLGGNDDDTYRNCVFWVPPSDAAYGQWSDKGCQLVESSSQLTECHCDHLTSFAVLVGSDLSGRAEYILNIFTIVASCMSIVALIMYSLTLLMFKTLRKMEMTKMRVNFSISLLAFYVTFLLSDIAVGKEKMCKNFATAIHYCCLVTVSWMTVEAVYLFNKFVRVMQSRSGMKYYFLVSFILAYGVPLVPVLVVRFHPGNNDYENYCFLPPGTYLYYGFLLEVGLLITTNTVIFIALVRAVVFRKNISRSAEANRKEIISRIRFLIIVWVLLGLSWIFGFLAAIPNRKTIAFEVLFCIFISFQGVFVLVIVLLTSKEAKSKMSEVGSTVKDGLATGIAKVTARSETFRLTKRGNVDTADSGEVYSSNSEATSGAYVNSFTDITE